VSKARILCAIAVAGTALGATPAVHATPGSDGGARFDLPETSVEISLVGLDDGGSACTTTLGSPAISFSRPAGGTTLREYAKIIGRTTCSGGVTAYAQLVDVAPTMTTAATSASAYKGTYTNGTATATATASQYVSYFTTGPAGTTLATRPASYVTMQVAARNRYATVCLEYQFAVVNGSQITPVGVKSC
jgi:hypothetical protein